MRAVRRSAWLMILPALFALASCGIPTTGAVEAGGPASGVVPRVRVYFVVDDTLVGVLRRTAAPVDVESAVRILLQGPTPAEQASRLTTMLPPPALAAPPVPTANDAAPVPQSSSDSSDPVRVTSHDGGVSIELSVPVRRPADLAAAQLICTALEAQRVAHPGTTPLPVTVTGVDGRRIATTGTSCPTRS